MDALRPGPVALGVVPRGIVVTDTCRCGAAQVEVNGWNRAKTAWVEPEECEWEQSTSS